MPLFCAAQRRRTAAQTKESNLEDQNRIGVGLISVGWMGRLHSRAYLATKQFFPELPRHPELVIADSLPSWMSEEDLQRKRAEPLSLDDEPPHGLLSVVIDDRGRP